MPFESKSIAFQIDCLARLTGAPSSFVCQVKQLFSSKGIPLEADASPYIAALEEAFRREESIRTSAKRAHKSIANLHENFRKIGRSYVRQLEHMRKSHSKLKGKRKQLAQGRKAGYEIAIPGDHRSIITRQQNDDLPMVPGPEEKQ